MKKHIILLVLAVILPLNVLAQNRPVTGTVLLNGKEIPAEYTLNGSQATLGSGRNACISQFSRGRVIVPATIVVDGNTYDVTKVAPMAFRFCNRISFVELPEGVKSIGNFAFKGCTSLDDVVLPSTLLTIGSGAFVGLKNLRAVYCQSDEPPRWEYNDVFCRHAGGIGSTQTYTNTTATLYVPEGTVDAYRNSAFSDASLGWTTPDGWGYFANIKVPNDYETEWGLGISTPLALYRFHDRVSNGETFEGKTVKLEADLDMGREEWFKGIGGGGTQFGRFSGTFDGQGHTISNLSINIESHNDLIQGLGFFYQVYHATITNLRLDNFNIISQSLASLAGGIVSALSTSSDFSNIYVSNSQMTIGGHVGGLVGWDQGSDFNKCVSDNTRAIHSQDKNDDGNSGNGGLVGYGYNTTITNCAVINQHSPTALDNTCIRGPFVGKGVSRTSIDSSYTDAKQFERFVPTASNGYTHGSHVVVYGQDVYNPFMRKDAPINTVHMKNFMYLVSVLGLDNWVYCIGEYPLPDCFEDRYPVRVNHFSLRPASLTTPRPNALTPTEEISETDWKLGDYRNASFTASSLWIDDSLNYADREQIPIGTAIIECTNGVRYDRTLTAPASGTQTIEYPVYQTDENGMIVFDENGQRIPTGETKTVEETIYAPTPYCFYLPYPLTFSHGIRLYQPTKVETAADGNLAQATFAEQAGREAKAWTPYYAVVEAHTVELSTEEHVVIPRLTDLTVDAGNGYFFEGTSAKVSRSTKDAYLLQPDMTWQKQGDDIMPFRSYFYSTVHRPTAITTKLTGDADKNGYVDGNDIAALVAIILGKDSRQPYLYDHEAADVDGNGTINIADVATLVDILFGK